MQYLITEATCIKVNREDAKAQKDAEMKHKKEEAKQKLKSMFK